MKSPSLQIRKGPRSLALGISVAIVVASVAVVAIAAPTVGVRVTNVALSAAAKGSAEVTIQTDKKPSFSARIADGGNRIIVDIEGAKVDGAPPAIVEGNDVVAGVMTQAFEGGATRVLVQLAHPATYRIRVVDNGLAVSLKSADKTGVMDAPVVPEAAPQEATKPAELHVTDVRYDHAADRDRVYIALDSDAKFTESTNKDAHRIEIAGAHIPAALERTLDVGAFHGVVKSISAFQKKTDGAVIVDISCLEGATTSVSREGDTLVVSAVEGASPAANVAVLKPASLDTGKAPDGGVARKVKTISHEDAPDLPSVTTSFSESSVEAEKADAFMPGMAMQPKTGGGGGADAPQANGRRVNLDLKDADIHDVLRLLADVGHVNVVIADNVTGAVTIRMQNVPWDQALDTILQAKGLGMARKGNLIRVAQLADLNKERELALARRKSEFELAPIETRLVPISYANAKDMQDRAKDMLSPRGSVAVDERTNVLIVRDVTGNLNQIEELVRALDTQTPQVLIEARIVEAGSTFSREVGIQWGGDATFSQATGNDTGIAFPNSIGLAGGATDGQTPTAGLSPTSNTVSNPNFAVNLPAAAGLGSGGALGLTFGSVDGNFNLNVRLSALEATGMGRIISSPRVLTLDNKTARISSGTLIPFSQVGAQGVQTVFQEAKLQLLVTPHVTSDGSVSMQVRINRDEPDFSRLSARGDPTILKREVETALLLQDGHTAVIGGIYTRNSTRNINQVPLLGDIPILGILFQKRTVKDDRTELVVFLTPRIVNRSESLGH